MTQETNELSFVPEKDGLFIKNDTYDFLEKVIQSGVFYPVYITGDSGNGKTMTVRQVCSELNRECIRVNFNIETDETLLIGGYTLSKGDTVFQEGPIITAMKRGAVLLLDEIDASHPNKVLCLQSVIDGQGVLIKETGEFVKPKQGFTVIATANTKGKGSDSGRFIGANMQNSALLDRFPAMIEQQYPSKEAEKKILVANIDSMYGEQEVTDDQVTYQIKMIESLTDWSDSIRIAYRNDTIDDVITTRTLVNIVKGWFITNDIEKSIELACNRYESHVKSAMMESWRLCNKLQDVSPQDTIEDGDFVKVIEDEVLNDKINTMIDKLTQNFTYGSIRNHNVNDSSGRYSFFTKNEKYYRQIANGSHDESGQWRPLGG